MTNRTMRIMFLALVTTSTFLVACSNQPSQSGDPSSTPGGALVQVQTGSGAFASYFPATLDVYAGKTPAIEFGMAAARGEQQWSAVARLRKDQTTAGAVTIALTTAPLAEGTGKLTLTGHDAGVDGLAASGSLEFTVTKGKVTGSVHGASSSLDATFQGAVAVSCWVPSSALPSSPSGGITPDPGSSAEVLSRDETFVTPQCSPFKQLMP